MAVNTTMSIKNFAFVVTLLFVGVAHSKDGIIPLPHCDVPGPAPVEYYATTQRFINSHGGAIATAGRNPANGKYFIMYDKLAFQQFPPAFQRWVFAHECAHHQLGHTQHPYQPANKAKANRDERDADCAAAKNLADLSEQDWNTITATMSDRKLLQQFTGIPDYVNQDQFGYHGDDAERVATVKQCLQNSRR